MQISKETMERIEKLVSDKFISVQKHPTANLWIYNYTHKAQIEKMWTPETRMCRGLILDEQKNIVARPFEKFFNMGEHVGTLPNEDPVIYDKLDGSLGILYWIGAYPQIATRGSFISDQAIKGTKMIQAQSELWSYLRGNCTHLFEIIYPQNRIVVDYGGMEALVLLDAIDNETGLSVRTEAFKHFPTAQKLLEIELTRDNAEGYVLFYPESNLRLKVKHEEYVRLHRLVTGVNKKSIWELLMNEQPFDELIERVPDEFYEWVKQTKKELEEQFTEIETSAKLLLETVRNKPRKEIGLEMQSHRELSGIVFSMLDNKNYKKTIWKMIRPVAEKPYKQEI